MRLRHSRKPDQKAKSIFSFAYPMWEPGFRRTGPLLTLVGHKNYREKFAFTHSCTMEWTSYPINQSINHN